jgi:hypothetical protein
MAGWRGVKSRLWLCAAVLVVVLYASAPPCARPALDASRRLAGRSLEEEEVPAVERMIAHIYSRVSMLSQRLQALQVQVEAQERHERTIMTKLDAALAASPKIVKPSTIRDLEPIPELCRTDEAIELKIYPQLQCFNRTADELAEMVKREARIQPYTRKLAPLSSTDQLAFLERESVRNQESVRRFRPMHLNTSVCGRLLDDPDHIFQAMWGIGLQKMAPLCVPTGALLQQWIGDMLAGTVCKRNWQEGNTGCSKQRLMPSMAKPGPVLLGLPEGVARLCNKHIGCAGKHRLPVAIACNAANLNIFGLNGQDPQPTMCRTLEWLVCAARGQLPQQSGNDMTFGTAPHSADLLRLNDDASGFVFSTHDLFPLHVCLLTRICKNADSLFRFERRASVFNCVFDDSWLRRGIFSLRPRDSVPDAAVAQG